MINIISSMPQNKPPPLLHHINELKKEINALRGDITYIKEFIERYEENKKKKDMIVVDTETDGDTTETLASSPPERSSWFW
jgi:hypothetical protein